MSMTEEYTCNNIFADNNFTNDESMFTQNQYTAITKAELFSMLKEGIYDLLLQYNEELAETFDELKNPTLDTVADILYLAGADEINVG